MSVGTKSRRRDLIDLPSPEDTDEEDTEMFKPVRTWTAPQDITEPPPSMPNGWQAGYRRLQR